MPELKPITISFQLVPGRDDRLIKFLAPDHINNSASVRLGLNLYIDKIEGKADFEAKALAALTRIEKAIQGGVSPQPKRETNPFLNASP